MLAYIKILGIVSLAGVLLLWIYCYYRGRQLVQYLKRRHPTKWEDAGKPHPDYFSPTTNQHWISFISQKEFPAFRDTKVEEMCRNQKQWERSLLILTISFFIVFGGFALWNQYTS